MATGSGIPQSTAIQTTDITPSYSVPHDTAIADALTGLGQKVDGVIQNVAKQHYAQVGAQEGADVAAGKTPYHQIPVITEVGQARAAAFNASYMAGIKTDIDEHVQQTALDHPYDPAGFKDAGDALVSGYVKGAPPPFAAQVQDYARAKSGLAYERLSGQKAERDQTIAVNGMEARQKTLESNILGRAASGQDGSVEQIMDSHEWEMNNQERVSNPIYAVSPDQAQAAQDSLGEKQAGAVLTYHATLAYNDHADPTRPDLGGGEAGKLAALQLIDKEVLQPGGSLAGLDPATKLKVYGAARANIIDLDKASAEARTIDAQNKRDLAAAQRDTAGTLALGLTDGSVSESTIYAAEAHGDIQDGEAARLILGARSQARAAAAQARVATATERASNYGALSVLAANGQLTPAALDKAHSTGTVDDLHYLSLRSNMSKATKPTVDDIAKVAADNYKFAGVPKPQADEYEMRLRVDAQQWAVNNPNATPGQKLQFAGQWLKQNSHLTIAGVPTGGGSAVQSRAQHDAAVRKNYGGQIVSQSDLDRSWALYKQGHPAAK